MYFGFWSRHMCHIKAGRGFHAEQRPHIGFKIEPGSPFRLLQHDRRAVVIGQQLRVRRLGHGIPPARAAYPVW